jgi:hypothetical protein
VPFANRLCVNRQYGRVVDTPSSHRGPTDNWHDEENIGFAKGFRSYRVMHKLVARPESVGLRDARIIGLLILAVSPQSSSLQTVFHQYECQANEISIHLCGGVYDTLSAPVRSRSCCLLISNASIILSNKVGLLRF